MLKLKAPLTNIANLHAGDEVEFAGVLYTARDAAHLRLVNLIENEKELPIPMEGAVIYYVGPCPAKPGSAIGSAGPTTSSRMDKLTVPLLERGLKGMIGKGGRSDEVVEAIKKHKAVYFAAIGGVGALISQKINKAEVVAYPELGPEAIYRIEVVKFPAIVAIDSYGNNIYEIGRKTFAFHKE